MKLYDPARPKVGDRPALLWEGKVVGAVPAISFFPRHDAVTSIAEVCVVIAPATGRWLSNETFNAQQLLREFSEDPERTLRSVFRWSYNSGRGRFDNTSRLSVGDLGELE